MNSEQVAAFLAQVTFDQPILSNITKYVDDDFFPELLQAEVDRIRSSTSFPKTDDDTWESFRLQKGIEDRILKLIYDCLYEEECRLVLGKHLVKKRMISEG